MEEGEGEMSAAPSLINDFIHHLLISSDMSADEFIHYETPS